MTGTHKTSISGDKSAESKSQPGYPLLDPRFANVGASDIATPSRPDLNCAVKEVNQRMA
jgi:hypothetical protein